MFFASFTIAHFAAIVVDYLFINKGICSLVNPTLMDWTLKIEQIFRNYRKKETSEKSIRELFLEIEKKESKNKKRFQKLQE